MSETLGFFLMGWLDPGLLALVAAGTFAGIYVGAIPGLSVTMAASILISFTFKWEVDAALALISGVYVGGVYGGARTAILLNIPGAPSAIATALDGYPLAQKGLAGEAIGLSTVMSVIGGLIGVAALALAAPAISDLAIRFTSRDYMLLGLIGILLVGTLSGESFAKGVFAGALGRDDRHGRARSDDGGGALHLRVDQPDGRHSLYRRDDRVLRGGRGAGAARASEPAGDPPEGRADRAGLAGGAALSEGGAARLGDRHADRGVAGDRGRYRRPAGL